jgi:Domain of unknown function (DUF4133)
MSAKVYSINRGINKPITFRGFKAQYILYAGGIIAGDLLLFAILYILKVNSWVCIAICFGLGGYGLRLMHRLGSRYGQFGVEKKRAAKKIPKVIRSSSRTIFIQLKNGHENI